MGKATKTLKKSTPKRRIDRAKEATGNKPKLRLEFVEASTLNGNPLNWRTHPEAQIEALNGVLRDPEIGWAGALLFNEQTGNLIDGHGRLKVVEPHETVPVLIGSWSPEAEKKILLTLDPIAAMAGAAEQKLEELRAQVSLDAPVFVGLQEQINQTLSNMRKQFETPAADPDGSNGEPAPGEPPAPTDGAGGGGRSITDQFKVIFTLPDEMTQADVIDAVDNQQWERLAELLKNCPIKPISSPGV